MATTPAKSAPKNTPGQPQQPPDERFWKRYSPHHECPVSITGSIALHVLVAAILAGAIPFLSFSCVDNRTDGPAAPPRMELVEIMGGDPGLDGLGVGKDLLGGGAKGDKTENVENATGGENKITPKGPQIPIAALKDPLKAPELRLDSNPNEPPELDDGGEAFAALDQAAKRAAQDIIRATQPKPAPSSGGSKNKTGKGPGKKRGNGGPAGRGTGRGTGVGAGTGTSPYGRVFTNQQKRQMRWQILASPDGRIHLAKLQALKVTLVMPTRRAGIFTIFDLTGSKPVRKETRRLADQAAKVWWTNRDPTEVQALARVLRLRDVPHCFVIFLPKALEDRMVQLEEEYQGAREDQIEKTIWDVPLRNGRYASEPQVVQQILKGQR